MYNYKATIRRVVDGDTLDVDIDLGFGIITRQRVRLKGIDTPETYGVKKGSEEYKAGMRAKERVQEVLSFCMDTRGYCLIETSKTGKFGRWLAEVTLPCFRHSSGQVIADQSLNILLIEEGLAKPYN